MSSKLFPPFVVCCSSCKELIDNNRAIKLGEYRTCGCPIMRVPTPVIVSTLTNQVYESMEVSETGFVTLGKPLGKSSEMGLPEYGRR